MHLLVVNYWLHNYSEHCTLVQITKEFQTTLDCVCANWQPTVTVRACCLCLLEWLLSTSTATSSPMLVRWCHQDDIPGFHYQSPKLVQFTVLRHHWRVDATFAVGAECCGQADHWHTTIRPHRHACSSVSVRPRPKLPGWWLPTRHRRRR